MPRAKKPVADRQLTSRELAARWGMNDGSIRMMRLKGRGPKWISIGGGDRPRVRYWLSEIERYEIERG